METVRTSNAPDVPAVVLVASTELASSGIFSVTPIAKHACHMCVSVTLASGPDECRRACCPYSTPHSAAALLHVRAKQNAVALIKAGELHKLRAAPTCQPAVCPGRKKLRGSTS